MTDKPMLAHAREASAITDELITFSVCSIVNDLDQYQQMLESFEQAGFAQDNCEFLYVDNTNANSLDCYEGLNRLINQSQGKYIVLCHQDIRMLRDDKATLLARLNELEQHDSAWAVVGNAGKTHSGDYKIRISDRHGKDQNRGPFPAQVISLDENFMILKRSALLGFSADLTGYHLYGTDICIQANVRGRQAYVIDFHLEHLGAGSVREDFFYCADALESKYKKVFARRLIKTPSTRVVVGAQQWELWLRALLRIRKRRSILSKSKAS
ncbi:MAG: hypothetical protein AB8B79_17320 [Granulosicoccus sp.]